MRPALAALVAIRKRTVTVVDGVSYFYFRFLFGYRWCSPKPGAWSCLPGHIDSSGFSLYNRLLRLYPRSYSSFCYLYHSYLRLLSDYREVISWLIGSLSSSPLAKRSFPGSALCRCMVSRLRESWLASSCSASLCTQLL